MNGGCGWSTSLPMRTLRFAPLLGPRPTTRSLPGQLGAFQGLRNLEPPSAEAASSGAREAMRGEGREEAANLKRAESRGRTGDSARTARRPARLYAGGSSQAQGLVPQPPFDPRTKGTPKERVSGRRLLPGLHRTLPANPGRTFFFGAYPQINADKRRRGVVCSPSAMWLIGPPDRRSSAFICGQTAFLSEQTAAGTTRAPRRRLGSAMSRTDAAPNAGGAAPVLPPEVAGGPMGRTDPPTELPLMR